MPGDWKRSEPIRVGGLTCDGWTLERTSDDRVLLRPPDGDVAEIHHETLSAGAVRTFFPAQRPAPPPPHPPSS